jgi:ABC-type dipeptide/oligopeptide/nickel transport system ATPase component
MSSLLEIDGLVTSFDTDSGWVRAVDGISFSVEKGKTVGLVGESGCGKTVTAMSIIDLLPKPSGNVLEGEINFKGQDLRKVDRSQMRKIRGGEIGVIFQEPMAALNPVHRIGKHFKATRKNVITRSLAKGSRITRCGGNTGARGTDL